MEGLVLFIGDTAKLGWLELQGGTAMSTKSDFTDQQWQMLLDTPALVGAATMVCSRSGLGTIKEVFALTRGLLDVSHEYRENPLIQAVVEARTGAQSREWHDRFGDADVSEFENEVVAQCEQLSQLLAEVSSTQEAEEFKSWVFSIGFRVAKAAAEGGFLGFGGERISSEEERLLARIAVALGIRTPP